MKKTVILLKNNYFIKDNNEYDFLQINDIRSTFSKYINIIILEEELFIKSFSYNIKKINMDKFIEDKIKQYFPQTGDILYDYEKNIKSSLIYIYSIKRGNIVEKFYDNKNHINIIPIQYIMRDVLKRKSKNKNISCTSIVEIRGKYYILKLKNGTIENSFLYSTYKEAIKKINEINDEFVIYLDKCLDENGLEKYKIIREDIGENIYERVYKK